MICYSDCMNLYKFKKRFIIYVFCNDYCYGQNDYLYSLQCKIKKSLKRLRVWPEVGWQLDNLIKNARKTKCYKTLVGKLVGK